MIQVVWFKRDLRTGDHAPLAQAAVAGPVLPLYVAEPDYWRLPDVSTRQWMAQRSALEELAQQLSTLGAPLIVRVGSVVDVLARIHAAVGIARLLAHQETGNLWSFRRDEAVRAFCKQHGIPCLEFSQTGVIRGAGAGARDRWALRYGEFLSAPLVAEPLALVRVEAAQLRAIPGAELLGLPQDGCVSPQPGTRQAALALLDSFLAGRGADYRRGMSSPLSGATCCSRLSVPLATGAVSVREVLQRLYAARRSLVEAPSASAALPVKALDSLVARLHWRGHFIQKLESEPDLEIRSFHPVHQRARVATAPDDPLLVAWASGRTGFPFIDACMRSLIATGWLNFRMRAMVQSFASYQLGLDWHASGEHLARLFSDYEPGIHWPQVQMQSGQTGINALRIYNPVKQGHDQDPAGVFTRRWVPELAAVPLPVLQTPWLASATERGDYPPPLVDLAAVTRSAKARLTALRQTEGYGAAAQAVFRRHGSRKRQGSPGRGDQRRSDQERDGRDGARAPSGQLSLGLDAPAEV